MFACPSNDFLSGGVVSVVKGESHLNCAVFGAGGEEMSTMREGQVQNLVVVLLQSLYLHTGDAVVESLELSVPRHGRCIGTNTFHEIDATYGLLTPIALIPPR